MVTARTLGAWLPAILTMSLSIVAAPHLFAQDVDEPGTLHTIRTQVAHEVVVGDVLQVRYKTRATADGIRTLKSEVDGAAIRRVAVVTAPLDPNLPTEPGGYYYVIVYFRAEKAGASSVRITPQLNDGNAGATFQFTANVGRKL